MVAFHVTRRGWLVAPSLSFRLRLLCMLRDPLNSREGAVCHMPTSAPRCSYFSPLNFAGAHCSQQAKGSKDTSNRSTPTFCRLSDVPLVKLVTQIREELSNRGNWEKQSWTVVTQLAQIGINQYFKCWPTPSIRTSSLATLYESKILVRLTYEKIFPRIISLWCSDSFIKTVAFCDDE